MSNKKTAAARRATPAVEAFERAIKAFGKKDYEKARDGFDEILSTYSDERDLADRARTYRALCERALDKKPAPKPKTFEDLFHHGVFLHNKCEYDEALRAFEHAAEIHPRNEHILYCIAACQARRGDKAAAIKALQSSITANPANRAQARLDEDFDEIRDDPDFIDVLLPPED